MPSTDQLELLFNTQEDDAPAGAPPLIAVPAAPAAPRAPSAGPGTARPVAPPNLFPDAAKAPAPAGEPLLTLSPNAASGNRLGGATG
ncbi:hypothetical protein DBL07_14595, partial [Achromobacter mucicolens]